MGSAAPLEVIRAVPREVAEAFYAAFVTHDAAKIEPFLHDDVEWTITGPVEALRYCGRRCGKAAVFDLFNRLMPQVFDKRRFDSEAMLIDGDRAAILSKLTATKRDDGRVVSYRLAQFARFRDQKVIECRAVIDSFDAVEQLIGHRIDLSQDVASPVLSGDLVAV